MPDVQVSRAGFTAYWINRHRRKRRLAVAGPGVPAYFSGFAAAADFARDEYYGLWESDTSPVTTDTHANVHYAEQDNDLWLPFAANVPVRTDLGQQTTPTRTNSIRNNSMIGAAAPSTAPTNWGLVQQTGYTWSVVGTGTEFGLPYIDLRIAGTDASFRDHTIQFEGAAQIVAANAEVWTESVFARIVGGGLTGVTDVRLVIDENTAAGGFVVSGTSIIALTSAFTRFSFTRTLAGGGTVARVQPMLRVRSTAGGVVDLTIRVYAPQMELGAYVSSPILTTSAAIANAGNIPVIGGLGARLVTGVAGIVQLDALAAGASSVRALSIDDGSANNRLQITWNTTNLQLILTTGGSAQAGMNILATQAPAGLATIAFVATNNFVQARMVGQSAISADTSTPGGWPVMDRVALGGVSFQASNNNYQRTKKLALDFDGPFDQAKFDAVFAQAELMAVA